MKKLVSVVVKFGFVVAVDDDAINIENICRNHIQEAVRDMGMEQFDVSTCRYRPGSVDQWDSACLPYGGDGTKTTEDYFTEMAK